MASTSHRAADAASVPVFILTVSDTRSPATDTSGDAIAALLVTAGHLVVGRALVRDEPAEVARIVRAQAGGGGVRAIITTGGTGLAARDTTYEAVAGLLEKRLDGFGETFRRLSYEDIGPRAMLSRAVAGTIGRTLVFVLPGSEAAVRLATEQLIVPVLSHAAGLM